VKRDYIEFQERSVAKGYLITFRCYGTWLHGDERGSVDRRYHNQFGTPNIAPNSRKALREAGLQKHEPFLLGPEERMIVESAIRGLCELRSYGLFALNVRTNHVHAVTSNSGAPERMMDSLKAYATKELRARGLIDQNRKPWSRHGSTRYLWTDDHVSQAVEYVLYGQGDELPTFD
jgi:REP element-mobilizing transposase RayT